MDLKQNAAGRKPAASSRNADASNSKAHHTTKTVRLDLGILLSRVNLEELARQAGAKLHRTGNDWRGTCPLHKGDNPTAFSVYEGESGGSGAAVRAKAQDDFEALGLTLKSFYIGNLKPSSKSAQELRDMGMLDMATYTQLQAADAMRDAASNPSGGAGLTAGIGAGMGIGNLMQQATSGAMQGGQKQETSSGGAAASKGMPDVMTPSEVAAILKVFEEDVIAAINDKSLRARKMGNAYRISKNALEEFLNS